ERRRTQNSITAATSPRQPRSWPPLPPWWSSWRDAARFFCAGVSSGASAEPTPGTGGSTALASSVMVMGASLLVLLVLELHLDQRDHQDHEEHDGGDQGDVPRVVVNGDLLVGVVDERRRADAEGHAMGHHLDDVEDRQRVEQHRDGQEERGAPQLPEDHPPEPPPAGGAVDLGRLVEVLAPPLQGRQEIGRASCREREERRGDTVDEKRQR